VTLLLEHRVREFYKTAGRAYGAIMGPMWFHGDPKVEKAGGSAQQARLAMLHQLVRRAGIGSGSRVLEFGSGYGGAAVELAGTTDASVLGISSTDDVTTFARRLAAERGLSDRAIFATVEPEDYRHLGARLAELDEQGKERFWKSADGRVEFDAVLFMESLCHLPDRPAFFRAAKAIIRPGGCLVGMDWLQRPYGKYQMRDQIARFVDPVCDAFCLARPLGTLDSYASMMADAGFQVHQAEDLFAGELCLGTTEPVETWLSYEGPDSELIKQQKLALDPARQAGVFTVGWWIASAE
jgi:cyclopropane fatty-acyl-phospholipid synthase-like methyltransferase